uniref:Terpene synthase metal-binding domain-containing protein n=1 Tax=Chenopodium quinoa TaxID=63459 RepID=A0A803KPW6_CHEQI
MEELPEHVKWSYYAMVEACEEAEEDLAKEGRSSFVNYTRDQMKTLSKAYIQEVRWCHEKYVPTYYEYMKKIALVTSPYPHGIVASLLGMGEIASKEVFEWACQNPMPDIIKAASTIIRLMNDIGGHKFEQQRKHLASAVQCLMEKHGLLEEEANEKLKEEVEDAWKVINQAMLQPYVIPKPILTRILNLARSANVMYMGYDDGYTHVNQTLKDKVASVLAHPIPMKSFFFADDVL